MTEKCIDTTALGLFFVALVSLPIAMVCFVTYADSTYGLASEQLGRFLMVCSAFILLAAIGAYRNGSNFGATVFGLVAAGVFFAGWAGGDIYTNISLGIIYLVGFVWSYIAKNSPILTTILVTTALIFIFGGVAVSEGTDIWVLLKGIAAIANFVLTLYLAFTLVKTECDSGCAE
ncbi:MAG: hypothetical protein AB7D42_04595 [Candidatus Methanomethylophilaceae archaeon]|nr:hypothetical protein [Candidatus Methanomethylophilaceae archaeon]